jgi:hypothetical protein
MVFMVDLRLARAELPGDGGINEAPEALKVTAQRSRQGWCSHSGE